MQYSPKLKKAMEEIKKIVKENDIAAFVVLNDGDFSEYLNAVSPSYSCAYVTDGGIHFKLKTSEVGKEKAQKIAHGTYKMVAHFAEMIGLHAILYIDAQKYLKDKWGGEEFPGSQTSNEQQNN